MHNCHHCLHLVLPDRCQVPGAGAGAGAGAAPWPPARCCGHRPAIWGKNRRPLLAAHYFPGGGNSRRRDRKRKDCLQRLKAQLAICTRLMATQGAIGTTSVCSKSMRVLAHFLKMETNKLNNQQVCATILCYSQNLTKSFDSRQMLWDFIYVLPWKTQLDKSMQIPSDRLQTILCNAPAKPRKFKNNF